MTAGSTGEEFSLAFECGEFTPLNLGVTVVFPASLQSLLPRAMEAVGGSVDRADRLHLLREWLGYGFGDDDWFTLLSYMAVFAHELRHFHEYLATPWGQAMLYYWMLLAGMNTGLEAGLRDEPAVVLPIGRWWDLNDSEFATAAAGLAPTPLRRAPPIASWTLDRAGDLLRQQASLNRSLDPGGEFDLTIVHLLEGSAFFTQLAYLCDIYGGSSSVGWYVEALKAKDVNRKYTHLMNLWYTLERRLQMQSAGDLGQPAIPYAVRNAVSFFSLCATGAGDPSASDAALPLAPKHHPASIFYSFWLEVLHAKALPSAGGIVPWLDAVARQLGLMTLKQSLKASVRLARSRAAWFRKTNSVGGPLSWPAAALDAYEQWVEAHRFMVGRILENPEAFFDPLAYVRNIDRWVAAPQFLLTDLGSTINQRLPGLDRDTLGGDHEEDGGSWRLLAFLRPGPGVEKIGVDAAWTLSFVLRIAAILWTRGGSDRIHRDLAVRAIRELLQRDVEVWLA